MLMIIFRLWKIPMYAYRLRVFHAVAKYRSYSRAAREALHISQPAVSRHVQALEEQLGVQLFHRVGKQVELTEAGQLVLECAEQMHTLTDDLQRALLELQGLQRGTLRLGASNTAGTYLLPSVLAAFARRYPGITVTLELSNSQQVIVGMLSREWDLGFAGMVADHTQLQVQPYCWDPLVLVVPPQHRLAAHSAVHLGDLEGETWILREPGSTSRYVVEQALRTHHMPWKHALALQSNEAIKQAIIAGLGIGMVSRLAVTLEVQYGVLAIVPIAALHLGRQINVITSHHVRLPASAQAFLNVLSQQPPYPTDQDDAQPSTTVPAPA
jgi:DNA-binding transcriptional LysR family regulator